MTALENMRGFVDEAITYAEKKTEGLIVKGEINSGSQVRFSRNSIDIAKQWETLTLKVFLILEGNKTGFTERSISKKEDINPLIDDMVKFTKMLPESMVFAGVEDKVHEYDVIETNYDENYDAFVEKAPRVINSTIDAALEEGAKRVAGALKLSKEHAFFRSSYGPEGASQSTQFDLNVRAFQDELDYSGQGLFCGTIPSQSESKMIAAGKQAGGLSKKADGAVQGEPGIYDLILSPTVAADVVGIIPTSANPFMIMIGMSPLGDKMGEQLAPEYVNAVDDPRIPQGLGSSAFDFEGTPTQKTPIIEAGVLKNLVHNTSTAKMYETETTGNSGIISWGSGLKMLLPTYTNIVFNEGEHSFDEMIETNKPTIYVTCNWYTRFQNYQTGEFSTIPRDAMFLIEDGEMKPIKNLRISDNTLRMFSNIIAMGKDRKQVYWWEVGIPTFIPTVKVENCRMSAATQ